MAGRRNSPKRAANVANHHANRHYHDPQYQDEARQQREDARETARELLRQQRDERRRLLAEPIPWKKKDGAHSTYTGKRADEICSRLITGETLTEICRDESMPSYPTVIKWLRDHEEFKKQYQEAIELSAHAEVDNISVIRRAVLVGDIEPDAARVANQSSQWIAGKRNARLFGDGKDTARQNQDVVPVINITLSK